jgi:hypothetical protein
LGDTFHQTVVQRACDALGGAEALAERLGVSAALVRAWLTGRLVVPQSVFFRVIDIFADHDASDGDTRGISDDAPRNGASTD